MTLTQTLRIEERYLQFQDLNAMAYCEKRWQQEGRPGARWEMISFIERMLQELKQNGIGYPKVLLLRKKEIQRGTFALLPCEAQATNREAVKYTAGEHPRIPAEWIRQAEQEFMQQDKKRKVSA